jgi:hypothetical protein
MTLYPRKLSKEIGGFTSILPYGHEDHDLWMKIMEVGVHSKKLVKEGTDIYIYIHI